MGLCRQGPPRRICSERGAKLDDRRAKPDQLVEAGCNQNDDEDSDRPVALRCARPARGKQQPRGHGRQKDRRERNVPKINHHDRLGVLGALRDRVSMRACEDACRPDDQHQRGGGGGGGFRSGGGRRPDGDRERRRDY